EPERRAAERHEPIETIAAVDREVLRDGAEAVRRVEVAVATLVLGDAPHALAAVHLFHLRAQVVQIRALAVQQLAEHALATHAQAHELFAAIAAILQHHAVALRLLGGVDELPALVERG